jgi:hypothetical protein
MSDIINPEPNNSKPKKMKTQADKSLRMNVWDKFIGEDKRTGNCLCCNIRKISCDNFEAGHIIAVANEGSTTIENLRPICTQCNKSMKTKNMDKYIEECGYERHENWYGIGVPIPKPVPKIVPNIIIHIQNPVLVPIDIIPETNEILVLNNIDPTVCQLCKKNSNMHHN